MSDRPLDATATYRALIDDLVAGTPSRAARAVRLRGHVGPVPDPPQLQPSWSAEQLRAAEQQRQERIEENALVAHLDLAHRETVARLLDREREAAFHDVLATFAYYLDAMGLTWSARGEPMPRSEGGLTADYEARRAEERSGRPRS